MGLKRTAKLIYEIISARPPRVLYVGGWQGKHNLGDEAIFSAFQGYFRPATLVPYARGNYPNYLRSVLPAIDYALLAGGTLTGRCGSAVKRAEHSLRIAGGLSFFGGGVANGDFWQNYIDRDRLSLYRNRWKSVLKQCGCIGVRGPLSRDAVLDLGVDGAEVIGDTSLFFALDAVPERRETKVPLLALNTGTTSGIGWFDDDRLMDCMVEMAKKALVNGWRVKWFVVWPRDLPATRAAAEKSGTPGEIICCYERPIEYIDRISQADVFAGVKLHAAILAHCAYVPSVLMEYRPKCRDHMAALGQGTNCLRLGDYQNGDVWRLIERMYENRNAVAASLFESIAMLRTRQVRCSDEIKRKFIDGSENAESKRHNSLL